MKNFIKNVIAYMKGIAPEGNVRALSFTSIATAITFAMIPDIANAGALDFLLPDSDTVYKYVIKALSYLGNGIMMLASAYLRICGVLLNASINLTMNISWFVNNNDAIKLTWMAIRDFSSIFFIGVLIYASICMILGVGGPSVKRTIFNIVMAGLLVNFSLFFTKALIDASNVLTLSIYRAIAPGEVIELAKTAGPNGSLNQQQQSLLSDNGIANVFMGLLRIQTIYDPANALGKKPVNTAASNASASLKIITATAMGSAIMVIAGTNFAIIALVFLARFAILILLLIFSPIAFLGNIIPTTKEYSDKWWGELKSQLIFPPVYFLMIYVALRLMTDPRFQNITGGSTKDATFAAVFSGNGPIGIVIQYSIVIFLIVKALTVALKTSGTASEITDKYLKKYSGAILAGTVGRAANYVRNTDTFKSVATSKFVPQPLGKAINKGLKSTSNYKFGSEKSYTDRVKDYNKQAMEFAKDMKKGNIDKEKEQYARAFENHKNQIKMAEANLINVAAVDPQVLRAQAEAMRAKAASDNAKTRANVAKANNAPDAGYLAEAATQKEADYKRAMGVMANKAKEAHRTESEKLDRLYKELKQKYGDPNKKGDEEAKRKKYEADAERKYQERVQAGEGRWWRSHMGKGAAKEIKKELDKGKSERDLDSLKSILSAASGDKKS